MWGNGTVKMRWLNWMVFDHRLKTLAQSVKKSMSPRRRCLDGSNCVNPLHCKFALRRKPKNVNRQTAQRVACKGLSKFKWPLKANRKWGVIGFFWDTVKHSFTSRALMIKGMLALSAIAKWSVTNCASIWFLAPGLKADLLLCVKACETIESRERSLTPSKIKSMSGSLFSSVAQVSETKSVETLAAWGCCLNSEKGPAWIGKLSPYSAGSGVLKTGSVPAFNNVIVTTPASSVVKIPLGGRSAVEYGLSIWFLSSSRLVLPLWVGSQAMRFDANMIISTGRDKAANFTSLVIVADLLPCCWV